MLSRVLLLPALVLLCVLTTVHSKHHEKHHDKHRNKHQDRPHGKPHGKHHGKHHEKHQDKHHGHNEINCPQGWLQYEESCYLHMTQQMSWFEARLACADQQADLVVLETDHEAEWLQRQLTTTHCPAWWTAGIFRDGRWVWHQQQSTYDASVQSQLWFGGQPQLGPRDIKGLAMQLHKGYIGLVAIEMGLQLPSFCEKKLEDQSESESESAGDHHHRHRHGRHRHDHRHRDHRRPSHADPYSPYHPRPYLPITCSPPITAPTTTVTSPMSTSTPSMSTSHISTTDDVTALSTLDVTTHTALPTTNEPTTWCPAGWLSHAASCYKLHSNCGQTHPMASSTCQQYGGSLLHIGSESEEQFILSNLDKQIEWWIEDYNTHPSGSGDENEMSSGALDYTLTLQWHQQIWSVEQWSGDRLAAFVCEVAVGQVQVDSCNLPACNNDNSALDKNEKVSYKSHEYTVHTTCGVVQRQAEAVCRRQGAELLYINSTDEMRFVEDTLMSSERNGSDWWTGGRYYRGRWKWSAKGTSMTYTNWGPSRAFSNGNRIILRYFPYHNKWMWMDSKPKAMLPFICKKAI